MACEPGCPARVALTRQAGATKPAAWVIFPDLAEPTPKLDATKETRFLFRTFRNAPASRNQRVAVSTYEFTSPGWRNAQTVEDIARQLHPDAFDEPSSTHQHSDR